MQLRWIAIGVVCFSAALLSACGNAPGGMSARSSSAAMSKANSRYDSSDKDKNKSDDDCEESEDSDKSSDKSKSLTMSSKSKDDESDECKESEDEHRKSSGHSYSKSMSLDSKSSSKDGKDHDKDGKDTCRVSICHVPGVNNCKPHKMRVRKSAVQAHFEHGDYPGACDPTPGPVDPPPVDPPPVDPPPAPQCTPDFSACTVDANCCAGSICLPDAAASTGFSCGSAG